MAKLPPVFAEEPPEQAPARPRRNHTFLKVVGVVVVILIALGVGLFIGRGMTGWVTSYLSAQSTAAQTHTFTVDNNNTYTFMKYDLGTISFKLPKKWQVSYDGFDALPRGGNITDASIYMNDPGDTTSGLMMKVGDGRTQSIDLSRCTKEHYGTKVWYIDKSDGRVYCRIFKLANGKPYYLYYVFENGGMTFEKDWSMVKDVMMSFTCTG
jgi:hypothetical protein